MDASRIPVIVGVGQINDRPAEGEPGLDSFELMRAALRIADEDAGGGWLSRLQSLAVVAQLSFPGLGDVSQRLADALGATPQHCAQTKYPMGDSPVLLLNEAAKRIADGEIQIAAIVGGEALRTAAKQAAGAAQNAVRDSAARSARPGRQRYGIVAPTDVYPLYENACRAAWGQTLAEAQSESADIWSRMSAVAAKSKGAWLRKPVAANDILTPSADNRPIAFPYTKLMVANSSVNQGAGFIVTSLAEARARGIGDDRLIYVGAGAGAREPGDVLVRDRLDYSASLDTSLNSALAFNKLSIDDIDCAELYSCFPCMPKLARRAIDWPDERAVTVFGGLTFGGGPVGNYMSHAIAAMVDKLRQTGTHGLLFGNGGFATTSHSIILSRDLAIGGRAAQDFDVQSAADAKRGPPVIFLDDYEGAATIETYTVFYDRAGSAKHGVIVARNPARERFLAYVAGDGPMIETLTAGKTEPVGMAGHAARTEDGLVIWRA